MQWHKLSFRLKYDIISLSLSHFHMKNGWSEKRIFHWNKIYHAVITWNSSTLFWKSSILWIFYNSKREIKKSAHIYENVQLWKYCWKSGHKNHKKQQFSYSKNNLSNISRTLCWRWTPTNAKWIYLPLEKKGRQENEPLNGSKDGRYILCVYLFLLTPPSLSLSFSVLFGISTKVFQMYVWMLYHCEWGCCFPAKHDKIQAIHDDHCCVCKMNALNAAAHLTFRDKFELSNRNHFLFSQVTKHFTLLLLVWLHTNISKHKYITFTLIPASSPPQCDRFRSIQLVSSTIFRVQKTFNGFDTGSPSTNSMT